MPKNKLETIIAKADARLEKAVKALDQAIDALFTRETQAQVDQVHELIASIEAFRNNLKEFGKPAQMDPEDTLASLGEVVQGQEDELATQTPEEAQEPITGRRKRS